MPGFPNSVADPINKTPYLDVGAVEVLQSLIGLVGNEPLIPNCAVSATLGGFVSVLQPPGEGDLDLAALRIPVAAGFGIRGPRRWDGVPVGCRQLSAQPGAADYTGDADPVQGSTTVLPTVLLRNPGRATGGLSRSSVRKRPCSASTR